MVQSSDRMRRWWAVPGSSVSAAGTGSAGTGETRVSAALEPVQVL